MSHAILSPSGASRWLTCTPSARLEERFPESTSAYAEEGTLAHKLGEVLIKYKMGTTTKEVLYKTIAEAEESEYYSESMFEYCDEYATFVVEEYNAALKHGKPFLLLEHTLQLGEYIPDGFGTADVILFAGTTLTIIDFKYGKGVPVSSEDNKQLMLYALGAESENSYLFDVHDVVLIIHQPRIGNITRTEMTFFEIRLWAETDLKEISKLSFAGKGRFKTGEHCKFCRAKGRCKALAYKMYELYQYDFLDAPLLEADEISDVLSHALLFTTWINAVKEYALAEAINGKNWPGYKLVEGRSNRKITDPDKLLTDLVQHAFYKEEEITEPKKLLGITKLQKVVGKNDWDAFVNDYLIKPQGKPALVPVTDKRPAFSSVESAKADFANIES